jgi:hypothetical protein
MDLSTLLTVTAATTAATLSTATAIATTPAASSTPATTTITAAATATTAARRTIFAGPGFIDGQGPALEVLGMEHLNSLLSVLFRGHFDEGKTTGTACHPVLHDINRHYNAGLREIILQVIFRRGEGEITDE